MKFLRISPRLFLPLAMSALVVATVLVMLAGAQIYARYQELTGNLVVKLAADLARESDCLLGGPTRSECGARGFEFLPPLIPSNR